MGSPAIATSPIVEALEKAGLVKTTVKEEILPGKDMASIKLSDILDIVRSQGETGSHQTPQWTTKIDDICNDLDVAISNVVDKQSLASLLKETST